jgi:hypothetical protein
MGGIRTMSDDAKQMRMPGRRAGAMAERCDHGIDIVRVFNLLDPATGPHDVPSIAIGLDMTMQQVRDALAVLQAEGVVAETSDYVSACYVRTKSALTLTDLQERYDLLQAGANHLRDLAVAVINGGEREREHLAAFLFDCGELDERS